MFLKFDDFKDAAYCIKPRRINIIFAEISKKMSNNKPEKEEFLTKEEEEFAKSGMRQYGIYSAIVFQMLATMGLAFWGGKKLNDHFEIQKNLLTIAIGFIGMTLAFYNLLRQLKNIQK